MDFRARVILEAAVGSYVNGVQQARSATDRFHNGVQQNSAALLKLGGSMTAVGGLVTRELVRMGGESAQFEGTLTKMVTQIGIARDEAMGLGAAAMSLGPTGRGPQELGEALFFVTSAGLRGKEALDVLQASARASAIGLGDTATVADLVTSSVNAYGPAVLSASQATDILVSAVREGKAEAPELAGALGRVLPIASEMGVSFDEVGAAVAGMTRTGSDAATSVTQLRAILVSLLKPAQDAEQALGEFGLSSEGLRQTIQERGLWAALMQVRDAMGDNEAAVARLFPNVRALAGFMDLTGANAETTAGIFDRMADSTGNLSNGFAEWSQTTEAAQQRFSAAMEAVRLSLGSDVESPMRDVLDTGTGLLLLFNDLDPGMRGFATGAVGVGAGLTGVAGAATLAIVGFSHLRQSMQALNLTAGSFLRVGLHPITLALGAATAALGAWAASKAQARAEVEQLTEAIQADNLAIGENTTAIVHNKLEQEGAIDAARTLGISLKDLSDAAAGNADAQARVNAVLDAYDPVLAAERTRGLSEGITETREAADLLRAVFPGLIDQIEQAGDEARQRAVDMAELEGKFVDVEHAMQAGNSALEAGFILQGQARQEAAETGDAVSGLGDDFDEQAGSIDGASDALQDYLEWLQAATDPVFALQKAVQQVGQAQESYNEAVDEYGKNSPQAEQAAWDLAAAVTGAEQAAANGDLSFDDFRAQLREWERNGRISKEAADILRGGVMELTGEVDKFDGDRTARMKVEDSQARLRARDYGGILDHVARDRTSTVTVNFAPGRGGIRQPDGSITVSGAMGRIHTGGFVLPSGQIRRRFHDGGEVLPRFHSGVDRLRSDEVPAILQTEERVLSRDQNTAFEQLLRTLGTSRPMPAAAPVGFGGGSDGPPGINVEHLHIKTVGGTQTTKQFMDDLAMHGAV